MEKPEKPVHVYPYKLITQRWQEDVFENLVSPAADRFYSAFNRHLFGWEHRLYENRQYNLSRAFPFLVGKVAHRKEIEKKISEGKEIDDKERGFLEKYSDQWSDIEGKMNECRSFYPDAKSDAEVNEQCRLYCRKYAEKEVPLNEKYLEMGENPPRPSYFSKKGFESLAGNIRTFEVDADGKPYAESGVTIGVARGCADMAWLAWDKRINQRDGWGNRVHIDTDKEHDTVIWQSGMGCKVDRKKMRLIVTFTDLKFGKRRLKHMNSEKDRHGNSVGGGNLDGKSVADWGERTLEIPMVVCKTGGDGVADLKTVRADDRRLDEFNLLVRDMVDHAVNKRVMGMTKDCRKRAKEEEEARQGDPSFVLDGIPEGLSGKKLEDWIKAKKKSLVKEAEKRAYDEAYSDAYRKAVAEVEKMDVLDAGTDVKIIRKTSGLYSGRRTYWVQFTIDGLPPLPKKGISLGTGVAGIDPAPRGFVVVSGDGEGTNAERYVFFGARADVHDGSRLLVNMQKVAERCKELQRKISRSDKVNNPDCYDEDGTLKRGCKLVHSNTCRKYIRMLAVERRRMSEYRKNLQGFVINHKVLPKADEFVIEDTKSSQWAKRDEVGRGPNGKKRNHGKAVLEGAPSEFKARLERRAKQVGALVRTVPTIVSATQYNPLDNEFVKRGRDDHEFPIGDDIVDRDAMAANNLRYVKEDEFLVKGKCVRKDGSVVKTKGGDKECVVKSVDNYDREGLLRNWKYFVSAQRGLLTGRR